MFSTDGQMWVHMTTKGVQLLYGCIDTCNLHENVLKYRYVPGDLQKILEQFDGKKITVKEIWRRPSINCVSFVLALMNIDIHGVLTADELHYIIAQCQENENRE